MRKSIAMAKTASPTILTPAALVPIGSVLACLIALFGFARHFTTLEVQTTTNTQQQKTDAAEMRDRLDVQQRDMSEIKAAQAATNAKLQMVIEHFGIQSRQRR